MRILATIFIPLARPALLTITVFTFIATWNDLWSPWLYLYDEKLYTLPLGQMQFIGVAGNAQGTPWQLVMAISTIMMIPVVIVFFLAQSVLSRVFRQVESKDKRAESIDGGANL